LFLPEKEKKGLMLSFREEEKRGQPYIYRKKENPERKQR